MEHSEALQDLAAALREAQGEMGPAKKSAANPHLGNRYADLAAVWEACAGPLYKHGLSVIQGVAGAERSVTVTTMLLHTSGQWVRDSLTLPFAESRGINIAQAAGSAITYARRYSLAALLSLPTEDDDGNAAHGARQVPKSETSSGTRPSGGGAPQNARTAPSGSSGEVVCPKCGGATWDNRATKKNPKQPDYKCRDKQCDGAIWPPKKEQPPPPDDDFPFPPVDPNDNVPW